MLLDEVRGGLVDGLPVLPREILHKGLDALRHGRTRQHRVHGHAGTTGELRQATRDRELGRLGHAVMDHLDGKLRPDSEEMKTMRPQLRLSMPFI